MLNTSALPAKAALSAEFFDILFEEALKEKPQAQEMIKLILSQGREEERAKRLHAFRDFAYAVYLQPQTNSIEKRWIMHFFEWLDEKIKHTE